MEQQRIYFSQTGRCICQEVKEWKATMPPTTRLWGRPRATHYYSRWGAHYATILQHNDRMILSGEMGGYKAVPGSFLFLLLFFAIRPRSKDFTPYLLMEGDQPKGWANQGFMKHPFGLSSIAVCTWLRSVIFFLFFSIPSVGALASLDNIRSGNCLNNYCMKPILPPPPHSVLASVGRSRGQRLQRQ